MSQDLLTAAQAEGRDQYTWLNEAVWARFEAWLGDRTWSIGGFPQTSNKRSIPSTSEGRFKQFILVQDAGTPDLVAFRRIPFYPAMPEVYNEREKTRLLSIEVKRPGNKPTPLQIANMAELEEYGARCVVATNIEDLQTHI